MTMQTDITKGKEEGGKYTFSDAHAHLVPEWFTMEDVENISEKASELKSDLDKKFNELSQKIQDLDGESIKEFKEKFNDVKDSVKEKYDQMSAKVKDLEKELTAKMDSLKKEAKTVEANANSI